MLASVTPPHLSLGRLLCLSLDLLLCLSLGLHLCLSLSFLLCLSKLQLQLPILGYQDSCT